MIYGVKKMKTINDFNLEEKVNLLLYKLYKREYLSSPCSMFIMSFLVLMISLFLATLPIWIRGYLIAEDMMVEVCLISVVILSTVLIIGSVAMMGLSVYQLSKRRKKLQIAFQMKTLGKFGDIFNVGDKDIKNVRQIWIFNKEKEKNEKGK